MITNYLGEQQFKQIEIFKKYNFLHEGFGKFSPKEKIYYSTNSKIYLLKYIKAYSNGDILLVGDGAAFVLNNITGIDTSPDKLKKIILLS